MDTALPQKFSFILDKNLAKANCTGNHVCTSCDTVVLAQNVKKCLLGAAFDARRYLSHSVPEQAAQRKNGLYLFGTHIFPDLPDQRVKGIVHPHPRLGGGLDERNFVVLRHLPGLRHVHGPGGEVALVPNHCKGWEGGLMRGGGRIWA